MKKIVTAVILLFACSLNAVVSESILKNVLQKNIELNLKALDTFQKDVDSKNLPKIEDSFKEFIESWKKVEASYIAGELDESVIDSPRFIDIFHNAKEDIKEQLKRILNSKEDLNIELFKNSYKSVNALEYMIFNDKKLTNRELKAIDIAIKHIKINLLDIKDVYFAKNEKFLKDEQFANALIMNSLTDSSYKLKEWRVGDALGVTKKYKDSPDNRRSEYYLSGLSVEAIIAILETHSSLIDKQNFKNFGDMAESSGAKNEIVKAREYLNESIKYAKSIKENNLESKEALKLYKSLEKLHNSYYISLILALKVTSKILDADGD